VSRGGSGRLSDLARFELRSVYNLRMPEKILRRWSQFSIRTMLILVIVVSLPLAWLASKRGERRGEQRAAIAIEKLGGYAWHNFDRRTSDDAPGPRWLRFLFGDDFFVHVVGVGLNDRADLTDDDLVVLDSLPYVEQLFLSETSVGDAGLSHLTCMSGLTYLDLNETRVSDAGVAILKRLRRLERLELAETLVTAGGVSDLQAALPNCEIIRYARANDDDASLFPPLHDAAKAGDLEKIRAELAAGVPVGLRVSEVHSSGVLRDDWTDTTPLMWAASRGQAAAVQFLIEAGADVNAQSSDGVTPLMAAAGAIPTLDGDPLACVEALLAAGGKVEDVDRNGHTALFYGCGKGIFFDEPPNALLPPALRLPDPFRLKRPNTVGSVMTISLPSRRHDLGHGDTGRVRALLAAGADVNAADREGCGALTAAAFSADASRVRLLLAGGADVLWDSALRAAARGGDFESFQMLLEAGAEPDLGLLSCAAGSDVDAAEKVGLLLGRGADPNESGMESLPPLLAALYGNSNASPQLILAGANTDLLDVNRQSATALAAEYGPAEAVRLLLERGFDPNERFEYWNHATVLIVAAESKHEASDKVRHLIAAGAKLEAKDDEGRTALLAASQAGNMDTVVLLAESGAAVDIADGESGMTALLCVANRGADGCFMCEQTGGRAARALLLHGADPRSRDNDGNTARALAEAIHHDEVLAVLDAFGID
jgi:uncharacterized protein